MALVKNKIAATARGRGSRDMAVVCIEHWKAFHYITSSNAEIGAQWIILPFTSVKHSKGYLSSFNFSFYIFFFNISLNVFNRFKSYFHHKKLQIFCVLFLQAADCFKNSSFIKSTTCIFFNLYQVNTGDIWDWSTGILCRCLQTSQIKSTSDAWCGLC